MRINAVSLFFYRPLVHASHYCTEQILLPLIEKVKPFGKSILGRIAACIVAETAGGLVGSAVGGVVVGGVCQRLGPIVLACGTVAGVKYSLSENRKDLMVLAAAAAIFQTAVFSQEQQQDGLLIVGELAGKALGLISGGYIGLRLAGSEIKLVDRVTLPDSYVVKMVKYLGVGLVFDLVVVKAAVPYLAPFVNIPRHLVKAICQTAAYNSQFLVPVIKKSFRERKLVPTLPLTLKMICNRYCLDNSFQIANRLTSLSSLRMLPTILEKGLTLLNRTAFLPQIQASVEFLGRNSDMIANITMRSLHEYMLVLKRVDPNELKASLKREIPGAAIVSPIFDAAMKGTVKGWADSLVDSIREMELELTGYEFQTEGERNALKLTLTIYLKYYMIFTLLNCKNFAHELTPMEERDFFSDLNDAFFSIYTHPSSPHRLALGLKKISAFAISCVHKLQHFIEQSEQSSGVFNQADIIEEFHAKPAENSPIFDDLVEL